MITIRSTIIAAALFSAAVFLSACQRAERELSVRGETMGTYYAIKVVGTDLPAESELKTLADSIFEDINQSMSTYRPESELMRWNRADGADWVPLSADLYTVVEQSVNIHRVSGGAFDVTVAPLVDLWGFGPDGRPAHLPPPEQIEAVLSGVGSDKIELRHEAEQGFGRKPIGLELDLSAIAKGYGADQMSRALSALGLERHMVEVGGELALRGLNSRGESWRIAVETPVYNVLASAEGPAMTVALTDVGMATSGDYRNWYQVDGVRVSHTIDPTSGRPITHDLASVTVIAPTAAEADAYATAINVLGPERGMALAGREDLAVFMIVREGDGFATRQSSNFARYIDSSD